MTLLKLRGKKVLKGLLPEYDGIVVSDRYDAYNYFNRESRQICWAHLARDWECSKKCVKPHF
ncbi:IS66 family transposase [Wolbachia endosymbiont (group A) of Icerya purchasi]|uniref:IS66 family transposase n=1 Tax=Wolbachia endosymbiont (group A) of Icerya purchasi TaxID=2954019 RepID=UPI0029FED6B2|nr:transposase [Wolbachia endosymbiont (group A) of Icerya purchasi]